MIREASNAEPNPVTSNFELHRAVNVSIAALITKRNKPNEIIVAGNVSILRMEPRIALISPNKSATQRYVVNPPLTVMPGTIAVATQKAAARANQRSINFML